MEWLSKKETCEMLGITPMTLNRYMSAGRIPFYKNGTAKSSRTRFLKKDVLNFIKKTKVN